MDVLQQMGISGIPGMIVAIVTTIIGVIYAVNSSKSKAEEISKNSYQKAIEAMKTYTEILEESNKRCGEEKEQLRRELKLLQGDG